MKSIYDDIETVLFSAEDIRQMVEEMARRISEDYIDNDLILVSVLKGCVIFLSDLTRSVTIKHQIDFIGAASYGNQTRSMGNVRITKDIDISIRGKDVLLIEDIYDSGYTLEAALDLLKIHRPQSIEVCVLLNKKAKHKVDIPVKYCGFDAPDVFAVGYGLDIGEYYRNLNCIAVLKDEVYAKIKADSHD